MKPLMIEIFPITDAGEPIQEILQWYIDEVNKSVFVDELAKENLLDMLLQILQKVTGESK